MGKSVGCFREWKWAEKSFFPIIMENGCLLAKKETSRNVFRNRLYLEKREKLYIYLRKSTYVRNYKHLHQNNKYFQTNWWLPPERRGGRKGKNAQEAPTTSVFFLKLGNRNRDQLHFSMYVSETAGCAKPWVISFSPPRCLMKNCSPVLQRKKLRPGSQGLNPAWLQLSGTFYYTAHHFTKGYHN